MLDLNRPDKLEACKEYCTTLFISDDSHQLLFDDDQLPQLKAVKSFDELFMCLRHYWSWDKWSILEQIIDESELEDAEEELKNYKIFLASKHAFELIIEEHSTEELPTKCINFSIILEKPYTKLTVQQYLQIKEFICEMLNVKDYIFHPFIKFLFSSLHLHWYIPELAAVHIIEMAHQNKVALVNESVVFVQVGGKVIFDCYSKRVSCNICACLSN